MKVLSLWQRPRFILWAAGVLLTVGCTGFFADKQAEAVNDCLDSEIRRLEMSSVRDILVTLDRQEVELSEFYGQCAQLFPNCVLASKFYHWKNEVKEIEAMTPDGKIRHKVRIYHNPMSACGPHREDPGRTHGDVAEFYNPQGKFMGIAVYMGAGRYCPLPFSEYKGRSF